MTAAESIVGVAILLPFRADCPDPRPIFAAAPAPARHHHVLHQMFASKAQDKGQGFVTSTGRYVDRVEAWLIAAAAGQLLERAPTDGQGGRLYSEDVW